MFSEKTAKHLFHYIIDVSENVKPITCKSKLENIWISMSVFYI